MVKKIRRRILAWFESADYKSSLKLWKESIRMVCTSDQDCFFMEIGAWDGIGDDFFYPEAKKHNIAGLLVEPQEDQFLKLKENYSYNPHTLFENSAVAEKDCIKPLFYISQDSRNLIPAYSSLKKEKIANDVRGLQLQKLLPAGENSHYISSKPIQCLAVSSIIKKHGVKKVDILQIDTEGYEYEILKTLPFDIIAPKIIRCEFKNMVVVDIKNSIRLLKNKGYSIILTTADILAVKNIKGIRTRLFLSSLIQWLRINLYGKTKPYKTIS